MRQVFRESLLLSVSSCFGALLLVVLTSSFNSALMMYDNRELHISEFDLLFIGFLMAAFVLFSIALN